MSPNFEEPDSPRKCPAVSDLLALKGKRQLTMLRYFSLQEAAAAQAAGVDIASVPAEIVLDPRYREVAPSIFSMTGHTHLESGTKEDYLRWCGDALNRGADAVYCSGSLQTVEYLARELHSRCRACWARAGPGDLDRGVPCRGQDGGRCHAAP